MTSKLFILFKSHNVYKKINTIKILLNAISKEKSHFKVKIIQQRVYVYFHIYDKTQTVWGKLIVKVDLMGQI